MFGFGKKKKSENENIDLEKESAKMPSGMKETAERMMSGQFDMNDMLAQLKQIKKMSNFSGLLKMVPGMSGAVSAMKEKIKDGSVDAQIKILEAMTAAERADPEKIFVFGKVRAMNCDHEPGAAPKSTTVCPFFRNLYFSFISISLYAARAR